MKRLLAVLLLMAALVAAGCGGNSAADDKFAGKGCGEIVAILQQDADRYKVDNGSYPTSLDQMVGKYIKAVPTCPNGGKYQIDGNGRVFESYN